MHQSVDEQLVNNSTTRNIHSSILLLANPSPTNSAGLHMIQEEHQQNVTSSSNQQYFHANQSSSSSSSEALTDENEMDCDVDYHHQPQPHHPQPLPHHQEQFFYPSHYHPPSVSSCFYCNTNPLLAQHVAIPTTSSSYIP